MAKFKRILLKLSGESLMGKQSFGIDPERLSDYAKQIKEVHEMGVQIGIVIGGGNIFRGLSGSQKGFDRVKGDQMGMCATVINSLALSSALGALGVKNKVLTAIRMEPIGEFYTKWKAIEAMEDGYICIFSAGTGSPYFTTDTGSSLRGIEMTFGYDNVPATGKGAADGKPCLIAHYDGTAHGYSAEILHVRRNMP